MDTVRKEGDDSTQVSDFDSGVEGSGIASSTPITRKQQVPFSSDLQETGQQISNMAANAEIERKSILELILESYSKLSLQMETTKTELSLQMETMKTELSLQMETMKTELSLQMETMKTELSLDIKTMKTELSDMKSQTNSIKLEISKTNDSMTDLKQYIGSLVTNFSTGRFNSVEKSVVVAATSVVSQTSDSVEKIEDSLSYVNSQSQDTKTKLTGKIRDVEECNSKFNISDLKVETECNCVIDNLELEVESKCTVTELPQCVDEISEKSHTEILSIPICNSVISLPVVRLPGRPKTKFRPVYFMPQDNDCFSSDLNDTSEIMLLKQSLRCKVCSWANQTQLFAFNFGPSNNVPLPILPDDRQNEMHQAMH